MKFNPLTPEEKHVIEDKGTEAPFSGEYDNFSQPGIFMCRRCNAPLFTSESKFDAGCGWPSFDKFIPGTVKMLPDPDGRRTEIQCARCNAHLGHVFTGEHMTETDTRHCVNSLSIRFIPTKQATFAGGCFWCTEAIFLRLRGVLSVLPGYSGGTVKNPTYEEVSRGETGHAEAIQIEFDPQEISYETLLDVFWHTHDPTTRNRQGDDVGPQYRSVIFYHDVLQKRTAEDMKRKLEAGGEFRAPIVTTIEPFTHFYTAEDYHKNYYALHKNAPYCSLVIAPKVKKLLSQYKSLTKRESKE